jgi:hypothetical protein
MHQVGGGQTFRRRAESSRLCDATADVMTHHNRVKAISDRGQRPCLHRRLEKKQGTCSYNTEGVRLPRTEKAVNALAGEHIGSRLDQSGRQGVAYGRRNPQRRRTRHSRRAPKAGQRQHHAECAGDGQYRHPQESWYLLAPAPGSQGEQEHRQTGGDTRHADPRCSGLVNVEHRTTDHQRQGEFKHKNGLHHGQSPGCQRKALQECRCDDGQHSAQPAGDAGKVAKQSGTKGRGSRNRQYRAALKNSTQSVTACSQQGEEGRQRNDQLQFLSAPLNCQTRSAAEPYRFESDDGALCAQPAIAAGALSWCRGPWAPVSGTPPPPRRPVTISELTDAHLARTLVAVQVGAA